MIERPRSHPKEEANEVGARYLANLGLAWADLRGKKVLDIGAMDAKFENVARRRGVDVVSVDMQISDNFLPPTDSQFAVAKGTILPFKDETFDYALAHMSVMNYDEEPGQPTGIPDYKQLYKEEEYASYLEKILSETANVLKKGGEFRFTNTLLNEVELRQQGEAVPTRKMPEYAAWLARREYEFLGTITKRAGFQELRIQQYGDANPYTKEYYGLSHFFIAIK